MFLTKFVVVVDILVVTRTESCHFAEISPLNQGVILSTKILLLPSHPASQQTNSGRVRPTFELDANMLYITAFASYGPRNRGSFVRSN